MEATVCYLVLSLGLTIAPSINYRRSVLTARDSLGLHQEADQANSRAQQHYHEARQAKEKAAKALESVQQYWQVERLN